jgi:glycosyltransferase involved in cell wall biosynthesis
MRDARPLLWGAVLALGYVYVGYPVLARVRAALAPAPTPASLPGPAGEWPAVTVLVVAHNEAARVAARLENLLALDYPRDRVEIVLASDGSSDATVALARQYEPEGVTVTAFEERRGKSAVLNDLVPKSRGEIVVLADARQRFDAGALRALVAPFGDPRVGAVSGELMLEPRPDAPAGHGVGLYWRYEKLIRRSESRADSTVGATGAIYAIRRDLFEPIPADTILDDVLIPLRIVRRGFRVLFEPAARAWDEVASPEREYARKVRTLAGNFQMFWRERWLLDPRRNRLWLATVSHKGLRLGTPPLHAAALAGAALAPGPLARAALAAQAAFYAAALVGRFRRHARRRSPLVSVPYVLCLLNWATVAGFARFVTGRQSAAWDASPTASNGRPPLTGGRPSDAPRPPRPPA